MSGPVEEAEGGAGDTATGAVEITPSRETRVGGHRVRRALPQRHRRTVGPWCFADHLGPARIADEGDLSIGPHPHIGLQTATWLVAGEVVHRDSLGTEQPIRPGQLNLMTAGNGVSHAEEGTGRATEAHGIQLWIAQPEATRHGPPAFEHHPELPQVELAGGTAATVLVGALAGVAAPARRDSDHMGAEVVVRNECEIALDGRYEHAVVVLEGVVDLNGTAVVPGQLGYVGPERESLTVDGDARVLLLGGVPFESPIVMWWNFVGRSREEIEAAARDWESEAAADRFGDSASPLGRIPVPRRPWSSV